MSRKKEKGFSLIEIALVIVILAILLAIGIPNYQRMQRSTNLKKDAEAVYSLLKYARETGIARASNPTATGGSAPTAPGEHYRFTDVEVWDGTSKIKAHKTSNNVFVTGSALIPDLVVTDGVYLKVIQHTSTGDRNCSMPFLANGSIPTGGTEATPATVLIYDTTITSNTVIHTISIVQNTGRITMKE